MKQVRSEEQVLWNNVWCIETTNQQIAIANLAYMPHFSQQPLIDRSSSHSFSFTA
jgi:hypothetical protein